MNKKRGLILSPPFKPIENGIHVENSNFNSLELRKYLLFWDMIDYPKNSAIDMGLSTDMQFLLDSGVLKRTFYHFPGGLVDAKVFIQAQENAFQINEHKEAGQWSLAQLSEKQFYTSNIQKPSIEFELFNSLPIPDKNVPLDKILEFKQKRYDELIAFRTYMDELYLNIINSQDIPRSKIHTIDKISQSLKEIDTLLKESKISRVLNHLRGSIPDVIGSGLMSKEALEIIMPEKVEYAMPAFIAGAFISFVSTISSFPKNSPTNHPLTYINSIRKI